MIHRTVTSLSWLAMLFTCGCAARTVGPSTHYLERTYAFRTAGDTANLYEAQAATHVFLLDGLPGAYDRIKRVDSATKKAPAAAGGIRLFISPMFRIRQLKDSSAAVRTPSFMPRLFALEAVHARRLGETQQIGTVITFPSVLLGGARFMVTHHSNGQAGCLRHGYRPKDRRANDCEPIPITDPAAVLPRDTMQVKLNRADGTFSSTFLTFMGHVTYMTLMRKNIPAVRVGSAVGYEWHPKGLPGQQPDDQRPLYGSWRLRALPEVTYVSGLLCSDPAKRGEMQRAGCAMRGRSRLTLEGELGPKAHGPLASRIDPPIMRWRGALELSHAFSGLLGTGIFVRWHDGKDYYNIGFVNRHRAFSYGILLDFAGLDEIRRSDLTSVP